MSESSRTAGARRPWEEMNAGTIREAIAPEKLGTAEIRPTGSFAAGSYASFELVYTAGLFGIDDSGNLRVCFRFASDQSRPQFDDPKAPNYCTVTASNNAVLQVKWDPKNNVRPWDRTLWIKVVQGFLQQGDTITIRFGVTDGGSPGMRLQTFCEETLEFRVLVDPIATFNFQTLPVQPIISVVPGPPERYVGVIPTLRRPGETFSLKLKGEDKWGNPSDQCDITLHLEAEGAIAGLPETVTLSKGEFAVSVDGLSVNEPGKAAILIKDGDGNLLMRTNPLVVEDRELVHFWGDMHGQSEETIGTNSAYEYFAFARDRAFVDACGHQGNDFQITDEFWAELDRLSAEFDEAGSFVVLPGYEWSGNTALGGDRNVYFPEEGRTIRRSSHALIEDQSTLDTDCNTARELFEAFEANGEFDVVLYAHCGGRYADIAYAHDGRFEKSMEIHSSWGTFEWLLEDALKLGHRVGVVANSDGHKGRPGASYPGGGKFGAIGGLTCFNLKELTRPALLDCMRKRRHYGTTGGLGGRMMIDVTASFTKEGALYHDDPKLGPAESVPATEAMMGDIVHLPDGGEAGISVSVHSNSPIVRVDIFNGLDLVETVRPYPEADLGARIRLHWEGAEYRGRFRQVIWDGSATVSGNSVLGATPVNFFNRDKTVHLVGSTGASWEALTTGNFGGADLMLSDATAGMLTVATPLINFEMGIADIGFDDTVYDASGVLPRFLKVYRLPDNNPHRSFAFTRPIALKDDGDNAIYIRVETEDGTRAWTSPMYIYR
ncbi:DUF3604 domain-containing protein [Rhodobium gokarnense]|uniref:DUF3604 domain-containing protein n=1 Tax=Rhodobium gokarnense TaxID=364296 RepID=A0ABT3H6D9_9HYPH|nr:DUF3604 domain-containing protein [Rhodobium gokarnense]MCW2305962.1 hypothetical protein [Rhodobium gokarnense]